MEKEEKNTSIDETFQEIFDKLRDRMKKELTVTDNNIKNSIMNRGKGHEYFVSLMVSEKRKLKDLEIKYNKLLKKLIKFYMSAKADIQASTSTEAKEMAMSDDKIINAGKELGWRKQIVEYLTKMNEILDKNYYLYSNLIDIYKMDKSNLAIKDEGNE